MDPSERYVDMLHHFVKSKSMERVYYNPEELNKIRHEVIPKAGKIAVVVNKLLLNEFVRVGVIWVDRNYMLTHDAFMEWVYTYMTPDGATSQLDELFVDLLYMLYKQHIESVRINIPDLECAVASMFYNYQMVIFTITERGDGEDIKTLSSINVVPATQLFSEVYAS